MAFHDHFSAFAERYAEYRPTYPAALVELLASLTRPDTAWDVGCGSGQLTIALAERFARVIATDPSERQLAAAPVHPRVEYRRVPAEDSGLADASVDLIVAAQAAHWFDWPRFILEAARVARPGALVALVAYGVLDMQGGDRGEVLRYYRALGPYWPPERGHIETGYRDLVMPWPPVEVPAIAMTAEWTRDELVGYLSTWSATARRVEAEGPGLFDEFRARLAAAWPDDERREIRWPLIVKLARVP
jgi:SAM-dependent methyltransferase